MNTAVPDLPPRSSLRVAVAYGAIGGFVGGVFMVPMLVLTATIIGLPPSTFPTAFGLSFGATKMDNEAATIGFGMHMLVSTLIGMTFGAATTRINRLGITGYRKGVVGGIITGMIAFVVIFIPLNVLVLQPILARMMTLMNPMTTEQQVLTMLYQRSAIMVGMGILNHLVYGAVLGAVTTVLFFALRSRLRRQKRGDKSETNNNKG